MYEQLQDILNKCIEKGWSYRFINGHYNIRVQDCGVYYDYDEGGPYIAVISYHDLFSKDSGLMEFVERGPMLHIIERYEVMGPMTAEEKVKYFISNAIT